MDTGVAEKQAPERRLPAVVRRETVGDCVQGLLDVLPVIDSVYHHLAFTRPLVDALVAAVQRVGPTGRVLVIGPNELLAQALGALGYDVDLWVVDGLPLSEEVLHRASRCGSLEQVLAGPAAHPADVVVAPYIAEAAAAEPVELLNVLRSQVREGGSLIMACRQPGELRRRLRMILKAKNVARARQGDLPPSPT